MWLTKLSSQKHIPCTIKANRWRRNLRGKFSNRRTTYHAPKFKGVHRCTINGLKKASSFGWKVIQWLKEFRVRIQFLKDSSFGVLFHPGFWKIPRCALEFLCSNTDFWQINTKYCFLKKLFSRNTHVLNQIFLFIYLFNLLYSRLP